jgi:hypothetical protein
MQSFDCSHRVIFCTNGPAIALASGESDCVGSCAWNLKMAFPDRRTANVVLTTVFIAGVCAAVYCARRIILIFIFAILSPIYSILSLSSCSGVPYFSGI